MSVLRHATRRKHLDAILREGLLAKHYGDVHGAMDYAPAGPSVYLSRHPASNNLNTALFDEGAEAVVVLDIDFSSLDPDKIYPDEALFAMMDEDFLPEDEADFEDCVARFAEHFGLDLDRAERLMNACLDAGDERAYPEILREIWPEYLAAEGEIAYLGDVPPDAISGWKTYEEARAMDPDERFKAPIQENELAKDPQEYALFTTLDARKTLVPLTTGKPFFEISKASPKEDGLTERDEASPDENVLTERNKRNITTFGPDQREAAINAFFTLMRSTGMSGVIDTPEFRAWEDTPTAFCDTVAEIIDGDANHPLNGFFEDMTAMCPERDGDEIDFTI